MTVTRRFELPPDKQTSYTKAVRLEWLTIVFMISATTAIYLTLGASQAMKAAWVEDMLSLLPPISFLIASRFRDRGPNHEYPYGYHRSITIAFLCAALALTAVGLLLVADSVMKLISFEHPSIGLVQPWGEPIWLGWFMLAALAYTSIPIAILGRIKIRLARDLHDKVLYADAEMNKADWMTGAAAMVGVLGIGLGIWWLDAAAALIIATDIVMDGLKNLKAAVADLMDRRPHSVDHKRDDPLPTRVENELKKLPWVADARARLREEGHVYFGDATVVPRDERNLVENLAAARAMVQDLDWKLHDVTVMPVARLPAEEDGSETEAEPVVEERAARD